MLFKRASIFDRIAAVCLFVTIPVAALADATVETKDATQKNERLTAVLAAQPDDIKKRYTARNPFETLTFFEVQEGDTVIETLPGGGWYSGILHRYLGETGKLIGAPYPTDLFERIGLSAERIKTITERDAKWVKTMAETATANGAQLDSYTMTKLPDDMNAVADKVLFIRSLHNLSRVNKDTGYLETVIKEAYRSLKPGGIAGVVQHRAPETASDDWANGSKGYLKQAAVIAAFEAAGFKLVGTREFNANPKDRPSGNDTVWRLPPSLRGAEENSPQWLKHKDIGESDRMTLKFVKPSQ